ncbi:MAG: transcription-repair coupling factor [Acidobacteriota bacterium]
MGIEFLTKTEKFKKLISRLERDTRGTSVSGIIDPVKPYFLSLIKRQLDKNIVFICPVRTHLTKVKQRCDFFLSQLSLDDKSEVFPQFSDSPYQETPLSMDSVSSRMGFLKKFIQGYKSVVITNLIAFLTAVPCTKTFKELFLDIETGKNSDRDELIRILDEYGYERQEIINSHGEYAYRGGIVDVFSPWETYPSRVEFSEDRVKSLRKFETSSQRSVERINFLNIPSMREFPNKKGFIDEWEVKALEKAESSQISDVKNRAKQMREGRYQPSFAYLSRVNDGYFSSLKKNSDHCIYVIDDYDEVEKEWKQLQEDFDAQYEKLRKESIFSLPPREIFDFSLWDEIKRKSVRLNELSPSQSRERINFSFQSVPRFKNRIPFLLTYLRKRQKEAERSTIYLSSRGVRKKIHFLLTENRIPSKISDHPFEEIKDGSVVLLIGSMDQGFSCPDLRVNYFSESDVFTEEKVLVSRPKTKSFLSHFQDLKAGDYVVHTDYGIGIFRGLVKMGINSREQEFIEILYRDDDKLFVPVHDLNLVQKYSKVGSSYPKLSKLGTSQWAKTKEKTKRAIEKMAKELLHLYAKRKAQEGYAFSQKGMWQADFEKTFEYEETEDQEQAINEVMNDMESSAPMDRLLCGDVGYGKTEVALRAAFKAVMDGKQVAVLCPTTVLSSQHLKTFQDRMVLFPIKIEGLTRLQSRNIQKKIVRDMKKGLVDIVIGTHRLLSQDVDFKDLGLLIVDEEQRFGVKDKEKIKKIKSDIDVLTMTATPIPRTLNLSLSGIRDISLIETPPKDRLAIHTIVDLFSKNLISSAIKRELDRDGQVYFVHNRVQDIHVMAEKIQKWVPQAKVVTIHGKMKGPKLERRMLDFVQGKYNVLISTTIIENGIDIPKVNTLIVNHSHGFGLAQLYQLRGRVGRSSRQAFAYLLVPPFSELTPKAKQRLIAIKEFAELGSGFRLAAKDLEIRGAGNFLGDEQHGFMEAVGFEYYMHLLDQTVRRLRGERMEVRKSRIELKIDIRIPDEYIPQVNLRMDLYKRVSSIEDRSELDDIREEVRDRYGSFPQSMVNLFHYGEIKYFSQKLGIKAIDRVSNKIAFKFFPDSTADVSKLTRLVEEYSGSVTPQGVMTLRLGSQKEPEVLNETISILKELTLL